MTALIRTIEFLTDGITESIINSVSQLGGLRVVPRSLVFRYKGVQADPATIGVALNARTILTGRVSQQGDYLTIQAELVDTATESQLWGEQFRTRLSELPNLQQDIAWQISEALRLKLTGEQKKKLRKRASVNPEAYQEYLRGRHFFNAWSPDGFRKALEHFERAIELDPAYAPAYAGLGDVIGCMSYYGLISPRDGFPRARAAAEKAIALDADLADAYGTLALGSLFRRLDWKEAARQFGRSIALNPKLASVRAFHSILLSTLGRHDDAVAEARAAQELDPLSPLVNMSVGWAFHFAGQPEQAIAALLRTRDLHGHDAGEVHGLLMVSYELLGRFEDAARTAAGYLCFGVPTDGEALIAAWRAGGAQAYWLERLAAIDRVEAVDHSEGRLRLCVRADESWPARRSDGASHVARRQPAGQRRLPCRRTVAGTAARATGLRGAAHADWGAPSRPRLQHRVKRRRNWRRHARASRPTHDRALQLLHLDALPLRQIDQERRAHRPRECRDVRGNAFHDIAGHRNAFRPGETLDFAATVEKSFADNGIGPDRADRQPGRAGEARQRRPER